jgi:hypothetical protein
VDRLTHAVAARYLSHRADVEVGYGPGGKNLSYQGDFPEVTPCKTCGKEARLALVVREKGGPSNVQPEYVTDLHLNDPKGDGFWLHDAGAFATYICTNIDCAAATTLWNQA